MILACQQQYSLHYIEAAPSPHYLTNTDQLAKFYVPNTNGQLIPLVNLITVTPTLAEQTLPHYDHLRSANISAQLGKGYKLGQVVNYLEQALPNILPSGTQFIFRGMAENLQENSSSMATLFGLALIFIYLILAALFESFVDPLIILLTVPLCLVGALTTLRLTGGSLNVFTDIGLITLVGLVAKHGILITQFINELRQEKGLELYDAILRGASIRLRPILMTTTAMVFVLLPLLFAHGASSASREQIGIVLINGLIIGTFFSLFVVPVVYSYLTKLKRFIK